MAESTDSVSRLTKALLETGDATREAVAHELGVSISTLHRWSTGKAKPHPQQEGRLRSIAGTRLGAFRKLQPALFPADEDSSVRDALKSTLQEMREILHRSGSLSSRHEALDEIAKLLFAHVISIDAGESGISRALLQSSGGPSASLSSFVTTSFRKYLPTSLTLEFNSEDFQLRLRASEDRFATEVINCFDTFASPEVIGQIRKLRGTDVLNDTFGQFLADSFTDEKELGQYLTPTEVVRLMVRLGLDSLDSDVLDAYTDPRNCANAGLILDPSCGVGSFLCEAMRVMHTKVTALHGDDALTAWTETIMRSVLVGIDKSERMVKLALTNLAMFGLPAANLHLANSLARDGRDATLTENIVGRAQLILTNPPFGAEFGGADLSPYKIASKWPTKVPQSVDSELLFMERYIDWLAPGGVLAVIVPDSILTNRGLFADLRRAIAPMVHIVAVVSLPAITFGVAGTNTKTSVLVLKKLKQRASKDGAVYFAVCNDVGFDVVTRGSHRHKVPTGTGELGTILAEAIGDTEAQLGRKFTFGTTEARWDAGFHVGLPTAVEELLTRHAADCTRVADVAALVSDRDDPRRFGTQTFFYIEIGDVDSQTCSVRATATKTTEAPSRARKRIRHGDILVSTVRPERRTIGVVPEELDGAICSTGFAVLRCTEIEPLVLARLLQSDICTAQIMRNNVGIAYPSIDEMCLIDVVLPIRKEELRSASEVARELIKTRKQERSLDMKFTSVVEDLTTRWSSTP